MTDEPGSSDDGSTVVIKNEWGNMIACPWCEKMFDTARQVYAHCVDEAHTVRGNRYRISLSSHNQIVHWCVCGWKNSSVDNMIAHFGDHGGFVAHTLHVMVGADS